MVVLDSAVGRSVHSTLLAFPLGNVNAMENSCPCSKERQAVKAWTIRGQAWPGLAWNLGTIPRGGKMGRTRRRIGAHEEGRAGLDSGRSRFIMGSAWRGVASCKQRQPREWPLDEIGADGAGFIYVGVGLEGG
ncbi:hypothetical protein CBR_g53735 [Chara braunii]|uniref:Uncharacterized protein n=1 Tax=Chara braunii TaxID=69332 RepID=A0A388MB97_CHABU|nr:hypothetical protein CBR_g53735 [Chara braunii]|eukprot:GBG91844.1 hypothetical protein CBR_g53735 [Chara braunii]